jgi:hypothetical protein
MEVFHSPIAWYVHSDIWNVKDNESDGEFIAVKFKVFDEAVDIRITNIAAVNESQEPAELVYPCLPRGMTQCLLNTKQPWNDITVKFSCDPFVDAGISTSWQPQHVLI